MKLHDVASAPNPRRVRIFLAEKGMTDRVEIVQVDMMAGAHKQPEFLRLNPSGKVPVLELDDGRALGESVAICRYLEAIEPEPDLMGRDPYEQARIEMVNRQLEFELLGPIGRAWVNGPVVAKLAPGRFEQIPRVKELAEVETRRFYSRLDRQLEDCDYMAGERFTLADITALCVIDFATERVDLRPDDELERLWQWHRRVSERPSAAA